MMEKKRYEAIDGLRTMACIGIVMMHIKVNNAYEVPDFLYHNVIGSFTNFVFLFMVISAFGMCSGYLDKMLNQQVCLESFYAKRYSKILPFFALLVLMDFAVSPSKASLIEAMADITLLFGLFPNDISVIGVGWFLGLIFAFYLIFPFYCVLIKSRRQAWIVLIVSLLLNELFGSYFGIDRRNIVYCLPYLITGGLIYLYRNELEQFSRKNRWAVLGGIIACAALYYGIGESTFTMLLGSAALLIYALGDQGKVLQNKFTKFFSSISMEVYLSHMAIFRVIEKLHLHVMFGNGRLQYVVTVLLTICGAVVFSVIVKKGFEVAGSMLPRKMTKQYGQE